MWFMICVLKGTHYRDEPTTRDALWKSDAKQRYEVVNNEISMLELMHYCEMVDKPVYN